MANEDYLLQAITGALEGFSGVYLPRKQKEFEYDLQRQGKRQDLQDELSLYQAKLPIEEGKFQRQETFKTDQQIRAEREKPRQQFQSVDADTGEPIGVPSLVRPVPIAKNKTEKEPGFDPIVREMANNLPKLKSQAMTVNNSVSAINKALRLIDKGVTGKGGELKALIAPYAEFSGMDTEQFSDAQTYQLLTRLISGPMRTEIVGPGQVSNYEQQLLEKISGGGGTAKAAAKELLNYYKSTAKTKIDDYNTTVKGSYSLSPRFQQLYQPINFKDDYLENNKNEIEVPKVKSKKSGKTSSGLSYTIED